MKKTDRFLIGLVIGIIALVIIAFVVTLLRPEADYQSDDTPEGVTHNYLLALQRDDYERAYGYLSENLPNYPATIDEFARDIKNYRWDFRLNENVTLQVQSTREIGNRTYVTVDENRFSGGGLFNSNQYLSQFEIELVQESGGWKIIDGDSYLAYCWTDPDRPCQ